MKKRTVVIGAILSFTSIIFFTGHVKSEEYICSSELSAFGRPGEVESGKYQRIGNIKKITYIIVDWLFDRRYKLQICKFFDLSTNNVN